MSFPGAAVQVSVPLAVFPPFRSVVVHLSRRSHLSIPALQGRGLAADVSILGGNRTGIYVQWVRPGSEAESAGLREGCRLLEVMMNMGLQVISKQEQF